MVNNSTFLSESPSLNSTHLVFCFWGLQDQGSSLPATTTAVQQIDFLHDTFSGTDSRGATHGGPRQPRSAGHKTNQERGLNQVRSKKASSVPSRSSKCKHFLLQDFRIFLSFVYQLPFWVPHGCVSGNLLEFMGMDTARNVYK